MPKCPECHNDIDQLKLTVVQRADVADYYIIKLKAGKLKEEEDPDIQVDIDYKDVLEHDYTCPVCEAVLTDEEDTALALLEGRAPGQDPEETTPPEEEEDGSTEIES